MAKVHPEKETHASFFILVDFLRLLLFYFVHFYKILMKTPVEVNGLSSLKSHGDSAPKALFISLTDTPYSIKMELLMASHLNQLGYNIYFFTNFGFARGCRVYKKMGGNIVGQLRWYAKFVLKYLFHNLPSIPDGEEEVKNYNYNGIPIGVCIYSSLCAKLHSGSIDGNDPKIKKLIKRYFYRSIIYFESAIGMIDKLKPAVVIANEKGYSASYEPFRATLSKNIPFIQWVGCQEPRTLVFKRYNSSNDREHPSSVSKFTWQTIKDIPWEEKYRNDVFSFFEKGYLSKDWFKYKKLIVDTELISREDLIKKYNLDPNKKIAVLFSHVLWDANLFYGKDLFEKGFEEWLVESAKAMVQNKEANWLIKIHPANRFKHSIENIKGDYREITALKEIFSGHIPENIKLILPEDNINPLALFKVIDYGVTVRGTVGIELPCFGVPVLTAGTGRYSNLGFTIDSASREEYLYKLLNINKIEPLKEEERRLACLHAYALFRWRPFPFTSVIEENDAGGNERDIKILVNNPEERKDFCTIANWMKENKNEDLLSTDLNI